MNTEVVLASGRLVESLWEKLLRVLLAWWVLQASMRLLTRRVLAQQEMATPAMRVPHVEQSIASGICALGVRADG